ERIYLQGADELMAVLAVLPLALVESVIAPRGFGEGHTAGMRSLAFGNLDLAGGQRVGALEQLLTRDSRLFTSCAEIDGGDGTKSHPALTAVTLKPEYP